MKIYFSNFGVIKEGEVKLNDLTLFCGPNNTGKTYVMYAIYGLFNSKYFNDFNFINKILKKSSELTEQKFNLETLFEQNFNEYVNTITNGFCYFLSDFFAVNKQTFEKTEITVCYIDKVAFLHNLKGKSIKLNYNLSQVEKYGDTFQLNLTTKRTGDEGVFENVMFLDIVLKKLFSSYFAENYFLLPAERAGLNLTYKELASTRQRVLHQMQRLNAQREQFSADAIIDLMKNNLDSRYAKPVSDYLEFLNDLDALKKHPISETQSLQALQKNVLNGQYHLNEDDNGIHFSPFNDGDALKIPLHFTSSTVKSLFGLAFFLEYMAHPGHCLMIDEPELNLHPSSQRHVARIIAQLVKSGIKVIVSTHSSHFIRELNNLIMLHQAFPEAKKLRKKYHYAADESLDPTKVSAHLFDNHTITEMEVTPDEGIIAETFDKVISDLNRSSNELYYAVQEHEENISERD